MADQGAARIKGLLNTPSVSLASLTIALANAMSQAQTDDNLTVPSSTFAAISALRNYYRNLTNTVRSIQTSSKAKAQVIAALKQVDASLVALSKGLQEGTGSNATADLGTARQQFAQGRTQLLAASKALG